MKSCVIFMRTLYLKRNLKIDINGKIYKILTAPLYRLYMLKICCLIILSVFVYIIKKYKYYDVTIIGKTIYGALSSKVLSLEGINHILCKTRNHFTYYDIESEKINLEGFEYEFFEDEIIPLIKNAKEGINSLESHTGFKNLNQIQDSILSKIEKKGDIYYISINDINVLNCDIISIKNFIGNLYIINTTNDNWITRIMITDKVEHLKKGETITTINAEICKNKKEKKNTINYFEDRCEIFERDEKIIITKESKYEFLESNKINSVNKDIKDGPFYNLIRPREFSKKNDMFIVHPFHLPIDWDPILNVLITTLACVK
jgi:hypothetical protein